MYIHITSEIDNSVIMQYKPQVQKQSCLNYDIKFFGLTYTWRKESTKIMRIKNMDKLVFCNYNKRLVTDSIPYPPKWK
jgi:hypothetical protein